MISMLSGRVAHIGESELTLDVNGVGYEINVPAPLLADAHNSQTLTLHTYLVVRETELSLYGFFTREERELFELLLGVNGVGPRLALAIHSTLSVETIRSAVGAKQEAILSQVPGVGSKTAQKIVLHLADRIGPVDGVTFAGLTERDGELLDALTGLGYSVVEAQTALQLLPKDAPEELEARLKLALRYFNSPR